jgi:predicted transcriptional regulator
MATVIERVAAALVRQPSGVPVGDLARQLGLSYQGVRNEIERSGSLHGVYIDRNISPTDPVAGT